MEEIGHHTSEHEESKPKSLTEGTAPPGLKEPMIFDNSKPDLKEPMTFGHKKFNLKEPMIFGNNTFEKSEGEPKQPHELTKHPMPKLKAFSVSLSDEKTVLETPVVTLPPQKQPQIEVQTKPKRMRITPYEVAHSLIQRGRVVSATKLLHFFNGKAFQPYRDRDAEKKIVESCREAVAAEGRPSFARQVCQTLLQEPDICCDDQLHLNVVAFDDGLLNLNTFTVTSHTPSLFVTTQLRASYRKGQKMDCPEFKRFLEVVSNHDPVLQRRIWQTIGYLLAPDQTGKAFFCFKGFRILGKPFLGTLSGAVSLVMWFLRSTSMSWEANSLFRISSAKSSASTLTFRLTRSINVRSAN